MHSFAQNTITNSSRVAGHRASAGQEHRKAGIIAVAAGLFLVSCCSISCNESLPPYEEPRLLFAATVTPEYRWSKTGSQLWFHIDIRNIYDETLQNRERLTGTLEIVLVRDPKCHRIVALDDNLLVASPGVTRWYGEITVNRGDTLKLLYKWDFIDDNGNYLPVDYFRQHSEPGFPGIFLSDPETFQIGGSFQVFDKAAEVTFGPQQYLLTYYY